MRSSTLIGFWLGVNKHEYLDLHFAAYCVNPGKYLQCKQNSVIISWNCLYLPTDVRILKGLPFPLLSTSISSTQIFGGVGHIYCCLLFILLF